jgi:ammonium transporter, Amt family
MNICSSDLAKISRTAHPLPIMLSRLCKPYVSKSLERILALRPWEFGYRRWWVWVLALLLVSFSPGEALAAELAKTTLLPELKVGLDTAWVMGTGLLVFFMNCGFTMLEIGLCQQKNTVNILTKNLMVFALTTAAFSTIGFGLMFGNGNDWIGANGFFLLGIDNSPAIGSAYQGVFRSMGWAGIPLEAKFFFELTFASTAATIVSGAVAERIKLVDFFIFTLLFGGIAYPIIGHWVWGGGWLAGLGFFDFAGSSVVHVVGGCAALMGAILLKPRVGKYAKTGLPLSLPQHSMMATTLGCFIMWLGWFGFNGGSTLAVTPSIAHIILATNVAAACGGIAAMMVTWIVAGKPDLVLLIDGILAGLVAITASCAFVGLASAAIVGIVAGVLVVFAVGWIESAGIDDPVGAVAVHLVNGIWGTLALGLFSEGNAFGLSPAPGRGLFWGGGWQQLGNQSLGLVAILLAATLFSYAFWMLLKVTLGLRVSRKAELMGLDISEHSQEAYPDFLTKDS